jgi:hypothetical protein
MSCDKTIPAYPIPLIRQVLDPNGSICTRGSTDSPFQVSTPGSSICSLSSEEMWNERIGCGTTTENGAKSYSTTQDARLDLFFKTVRGIEDETLIELIEKSWQVSPKDTLRTMFYVRDCRGGKGERKIFLTFMKWLWTHHREYYEKNLPCIPFYGCFRDLRQMIENESDSQVKQMIVSYWCDVIAKDVECLNKKEPITLAGKWTPIQNGLFCKQLQLTHKLFRRLIRILREKIDIVECKMSAGEWEAINFERVCSLSMKKYSKAFQNHCGSRFQSYMDQVKTGSKKMNVGQLYPSDIVSEYLRCDAVEPDPVRELQWTELLKQCQSNVNMRKKKFLCVVDTSGSMGGKPLEVAVSLGIFLSELHPESSFYRKFITFSSYPQLQTIVGDTLFERVQSLNKAHWEMNTNVQRVFELLLEKSTKEDRPDVVLILSDMQFDLACQGANSAIQWIDDEEMMDRTSTNLEEIERKYRERGIPRPRLIFWNLRANTIDFPATSNISDCGLVSGYSTNLLNSLLQEGDISPMSLYRKTIDNPRYDLVYCAE